MQIDGKKWFSLVTMRDARHFFSFDKRIVGKKTKFQKVDIIHSKYFGKILFLDGDIESAEYDERVYHECLVQPAMLHHPDPKKVLILGGGEGASLREVLKHNVEKAVMIDIDKELVDLCKKHLSEWHQGAFDDPRVKVLFMDAFRYLRETKEKFDVVIEDLLSPDLESSTSLFREELFQGIKKVLAPGGIAVFQAGRTDLVIGTGVYYNKFAGIVSNLFRHVKKFHIFIPSFYFTWGYVMASDSEMRKLSGEELDKIIGERNLKLEFYNGFTDRLISFFPRYRELKS